MNDRYCINCCRSLRNEDGAILVISLIFVCILAIAGTMAYQMSSSEIQVSGNFVSSREALHTAISGAEEARSALSLPRDNPNAIYDPSASFPDPQWTAYILATEDWSISDDKWYSPSDTNYFPNSYSQTNTSPTTNSLQSDIEYWVKIEHKKADEVDEEGEPIIVYYGYNLNSSNPLRATPFFPYTGDAFKPVEVITAHGIGGRSRGIVRVEVAYEPGPPILESAALYAEWALYICHDDVSFRVEIDTVYLFPSDAVPNDACSPSGVIRVGENDDTNINVSQGISALETWKTSSNPSHCYNSDYKICSSTGDLTIVDQAGSGILLVNGNLTLQGTDWDGLILVTGHLILNGSILGIEINGAVLVNNPVWINTDESTRGHVTINYDRSEIDEALSRIPLRVLSWEDVSMTPDDDLTGEVH